MTASPSSRTHLQSLLFQIPTIIVVAGILATLFTAWTDPGLPSNPLLASYKTPLPPPEMVAGNSDEQLRQPHIGIVAGHYGNDSGAVCPDGTKEVDINLAIAARVQKQLAEKGIKSEILREFDPALSGYQATLLLSIHADSCEYINNDATGFKVSAALSNPKPDQSARLVSCLRARYGSATGLPLHNSVTRDMQEYHAFNEIDPNTVAAIIEVGFLNLDHTILTQKQDLVAEGITAGILCYMNNEDISLINTPTP